MLDNEKAREINMKKAIAVLCILSVFVSGCWIKQRDISDETYRTGKNALTTLDQYLDGDITADEAYDKMKLYYDILEKEEDELREKDEEHNGDKISHCSSLKSSCLSASFAIYHTGDVQKVIENRNDIAEEIGESTR